MYFRKALATFGSDRIIFRSSLKLAGMVTLCDNADDKAVLMPIQREAVEKDCSRQRRKRRKSQRRQQREQRLRRQSTLRNDLKMIY